MRDLQVIFCWHLARSEGFRGQTDCEHCSYRQRWVNRELSTQDFVARYERRKSSRPPGKILVVDDEPNILYALEESVRDKGFECISACDGEEGLVLARGIRPNLIISDVIMPKLNGYELCEQLKADPVTRDIPVILVTVRAADRDVQQGNASGADAYLIKPFHIHELTEQIDRFLRPLR